MMRSVRRRVDRPRARFERASLRAAAAIVVLAMIATACRSEASTSVVAPAVTAGATAAPVAPAPTSSPTAAASPAADAGPDADDRDADADPDAEPSADTPTPTPAPTPEPTPVAVAELLARSSIEQVDCPPDVAAAQVTCSVATLPRNVRTPMPGEFVELLIASVDNGDPSGVGPVVFLQGGPGVGSTTQAPRFVGASHDLLFVDQRGTGYSTPKLSCPEVDLLWEAQYSDDPAVRLPDDDDLTLEAVYGDCAVRLESEGIDFNDFNTTSAAVDFELIRQLLEYEQWSLWGISYGTRLGLTIMRNHPQGVRAAVLDSIVPFGVDFFATIPENAFRSIRALDRACDADRCVDDYGDFFDNLSALTLRLDDEPAIVTVTRPGTGQSFPFRVDGAALINMVFTQLYSTRSLRALPRQIARADSGGIDELVTTYVTRRDPNQLDLSIGLYYTTWCREEFPFYDESVDDEFLAELRPRFGLAAADALSSDGIDSICDFFSVDPSPAVDDEPLTSDIPTLVFAGAFDPITPPAWSQQAAASLSEVTYVEMPDHGHGMATSCPALIRLAFLIEPTATPDTTCADETSAPDFE